MNIQEQDQVNRFRKKLEKDEIYLNSIHRLIHVKIIEKLFMMTIIIFFQGP